MPCVAGKGRLEEGAMKHVPGFGPGWRGYKSSGFLLSQESFMQACHLYTKR